MHDEANQRRFPVGAEVQAKGGVHFRVWAPRCKRIEAVLESGAGAPAVVPLEAERDGYFSGPAPAAAAGTLYRLRLDDSALYPDPASRFQPDGPHGPSQVVDPHRFAWTDAGWKGRGLEDQVLYEMHIGTFTPEGTWQAASGQLGELATLGVTAVEVMPVAEFPGRFGWGYDGVDLFAPTRLYGTPDDFRGFVDRAHAAGIGVLLDVVYNHVGPDGNYLAQFSQDYFTDRYQNDWSQAINFDGDPSGPVREFFIANAAYWIGEFHLDGLRLDATQQIFDGSKEHILAALGQAARRAGAGRTILVVAENENQDVMLIRPAAQGGYGLDALWNDDFHHSAMVALTGLNEAYYTDYLGSPQEFISAAKYSYLYQGQYYQWQKKHRGMSTFKTTPAAFVTYLQNHDQVANSARGERLDRLTSPGRLRAMTALWLLMPGTPMLFQGQEFASSSPFLFFGEHNPDLARLVHEGRRRFLSQFPALARPEMQAALPSPADPAVFAACKLNFAQRQRHAAVYNLHCDLIQLRHSDPVFRGTDRKGLDGAVLGPDAFLLRYFGGELGYRLLVVNLGRDLQLNPAPEPLLAPPPSAHWQLLWSSEARRYGGDGAQPVPDEAWRIPGQSTTVLSTMSQPSRAASR
jgi:maltooligosyltrehalose trehalohydrolase